MKKSTRISLVLLGSLGIGLATSACGTPQQRNVYNSYQDCKLENPQADCKSDEDGGSGVGGGRVYYGPWRSQSQFRSSSRASGVESSRGGFGIRGSSRGGSGG